MNERELQDPESDGSFHERARLNNGHPKKEQQIQRPWGKQALWDAIRDRRQAPSLLPAKPLHTNHNKYSALLIGQLIALVASSMNAASYTLNQHFGLETQFFQMFWMYLLLSLHLFMSMRKELTSTTTSQETPYTLPGTRIRLHVPWWIYMAMSLLDVLPNFLTLLSFRYTSLTSTTLLGSLTVPSTMFFSRHLLAKLFSTRHYLGVCLCLAGGILTVWSDVDDDYHHGSSGGGSDHQQQQQHSLMYIGDLLAVAGALLYGLGDTVAEYAIKHIDRNEYLGMLGVFGILFSACLSFLTERTAVQDLLFHTGSTSTGSSTIMIQWQVVATLLWYVASVYVYYVTEASFLKDHDATLLNLCMQASNLWAILFSVVAYQDLPPALFYVALVLVVTGVVVYERHGGGSSDPKAVLLSDEEGSLEVEPLCAGEADDRVDYETIEH